VYHSRLLPTPAMTLEAGRGGFQESLPKLSTKPVD